MVWVIIERFVHLMTLFLLILMVSIVFSSNKSNSETSNFGLQLEQFKQEVSKVRSNNIAYLEGKINRVAEIQDNYQVSTSGELSILKQKVLKMEQEDKKNNKIINNNQSNAIIYQNTPEQK